VGLTDPDSSNKNYCI